MSNRGNVLKHFFIVLLLIITGCSSSDDSAATLTVELADKRIYSQNNGTPIGWTEYRSDGTFIEDDGATGTYETNGLVATLHFTGFNVVLEYPDATVAVGDMINADVVVSGQVTQMNIFEIWRIDVVTP